MLYDSQIVADGEPDEFRELDHPMVQAFIHGRSDADIDGEAIAKMEESA